MTNIAADRAIVNLVDRILIKAIADRTSHLYFEPQAESLQLRIRQDGLLQIGLQHFPAETIAPAITYLKSIAHIDLTLTAPQVGTIYQSSKFGRVKIEITTLPTQFGDNLTLKIDRIERLPVSLEQLIPSRETFEPIDRLIHSDRGLILITGAQNSGRSATVAASLTELAGADRLIYAIDRQLKYTMPGVSQITLLPHADDQIIGTTIETCLAQNPDVLAVSIDSLALAQVALQAVARGCLVLATIPAATAGQAIADLIDLGLSPARLYTALIGTIAHQTVKQLCGDCRLPEQPNKLALAQVGSTILSLNDRRQYYRANRVNLADIDRGQLCANCHGWGYRGTIGIHEIAIVTDRLKSTIVNGDAEQIDLAIQETGMRSFLDLAISLFCQGQTTLTEVKRCLSPKTLLQNHLASAETYPNSEILDVDNSDGLETALFWKERANKLKADYEQLLIELASDRQELAKFEQRIKQTRTQVEQGTRAEIALQLLSVIDVIELARAAIKPQTDREAAIQKGYSMLENKMLTSIREIGIRCTESKGRKFDAHFHEIVQEIGTHEYPAGVVISELKRGYTLGDRVLRLAQVKVAVASNFS